MMTGNAIRHHQAHWNRILLFRRQSSTSRVFYSHTCSPNPLLKRLLVLSDIMLQPQRIHKIFQLRNRKLPTKPCGILAVFLHRLYLSTVLIDMSNIFLRRNLFAIL